MAGTTIESSVPYFKEELLRRLQRAPGLSTGETLVSWGDPHPDFIPGQFVAITDSSNHRWEWMASHTQANEDYDVAVRADVAGSAIDPNPEFEKQAYALSNAIMSVLLEWIVAVNNGPFVEGPWGRVNIVEISGGGDVSGLTADGQGRGAAVVLVLHVTARLVRHV